jgi:hypothetical protein
MTTLTAESLKPFCSTDPARWYLCEPWSWDGFTYATNGHILVRVARLPDVAEQEGPPGIARILEMVTGQDTTPLPAIDFPTPGVKICPDCDNCPRCRVDCDTCDGEGTVPDTVSLALRGAVFDARYIELITRLPGAEFAAAPPPTMPARFVFADGEGALMPRRAEAEHHFEAAE